MQYEESFSVVEWTYLAPSHFLNQCWLIVIWTHGNKLQWNYNQNTNIFIQENAFETCVCKIAAILFKPQCGMGHYEMEPLMH